MLHILILILKIIGIILLAILGIAIVLLGVVLFVPVCYSFQAETPGGLDKLTLHGKASWLFRTAYARLEYSDKKWDWKIRFLWKKLFVEDTQEKQLETSGYIPPAKEIKKTEEEDTRHGEQKTKSKAMPKKNSKKKKKNRKQNIIEKIRYTIRKICDKIKEILEFISDEVHQAAFGRVIKETVVLIRRLRPKKVEGKVRFGLKEPYDTGRVLAILSILYPFYGEHVEIYPEFEQEVLEGRLVIKGRAHLFPFVVTICKLFLDENVKTAYKNFRRK